ncbi:MAG TPA: hypothetical protein VLM80_10365 [Anaerolineales bacterium]|nr:hypothetical protein [Anaerolineales bacterium]
MEDYRAPVQPMDEYQEAAPQKNNSRNVVLIVVAVLVVLCCCCVGVGLLFYYVLGDVLLEALDIQVWAPAFMSLV